MRIFEPLEELEQREEQLRKQVGSLPDAQRRAYYQQQADAIKDPDTYAVLNWLFLGGFHHAYLGKYKLFALEIILLIGSIIGLSMGAKWPALIITGLVLYELPQLFFSQKIARQHNHDISRALLDEFSHLD